VARKFGQRYTPPHASQLSRSYSLNVCRNYYRKVRAAAEGMEIVL